MPATAWKGLVTGQELELAFKQRTKKTLREKVDLALVEKYEEQGFIKQSSSSKKATMIYNKTEQENFEDRIWRLLKRLKFTHMNMNDSFGIPYTDDPEVNPKQIDVFAFDGKVALVIECKQADVSDPKVQKAADFKPDIMEIRGNMAYQTKEIREYFEDPKIDVGFVFFTSNYRVSEANKRVAKGFDISVLNEYDLEYYEKMYSIMGEYAKTQILCDIFRGKKVNAVGCSVPAIKGKLGDYDVYTFMIKPCDLLPLSYVAHKKMNGQDDGAYQRIINKKRMEHIRDYVVREGGYFANNVIINIDSEEKIFECEAPESTDPQWGTLKLPSKYQAAYVIDGQHRLYGYSGTKAAYESYIPVTAFHNLESSMQSKIFVDINNNQKRVNANLLIKVNSESMRESDKEKEWTLPICIQAVEEMSKEPKNPLFSKIKDEFDPNSNGTITLRALESGFKRSNLIGRNYENKNPFAVGPLFAYGEDPKAATLDKVKKFLTKVYTNLRTNAPDQWDDLNKERQFLLTNNGFETMMHVLYELIKYYCDIEKTTEQSPESIYTKIDRYIGEIGKAFEKMSQNEIQAYKKRSGYGGIDTCVCEMLLIINNNHDDFCPTTLKEYKEKTAEHYTTNVENKLPVLEEAIKDAVKVALETKYVDTKWYRYEGFSDIARKMNNLKFDSGDEDADILDFMDINFAYEIIKASDWNKFGPIFGVKSSNNSRSKKDRTSWIDDLTFYKKKLRDYQKIAVDEYTRFEEIYQTLTNKFKDIQMAEEEDDEPEQFDD